MSDATETFSLTTIMDAKEH